MGNQKQGLNHSPIDLDNLVIPAGADVEEYMKELLNNFKVENGSIISNEELSENEPYAVGELREEVLEDQGLTTSEKVLVDQEEYDKLIEDLYKEKDTTY